MPEYPYLQWPVFRRSIVAAFDRSLTPCSDPAWIRASLFVGNAPGSEVTAQVFLRWIAGGWRATITLITVALCSAPSMLSAHAPTAHPRGWRH